jgi:hypothetical protein
MYTVLTTEFVKHNVAITKDANTRFRLDWVVQSVVHKAERKDSPSLLYIIFVGIPQAIFLGEADFGFRSKPHSEIIMTFRLKNYDVDSYRQTHIYSINDADIDQYWDISVQGRGGGQFKNCAPNSTQRGIVHLCNDGSGREGLGFIP